MPRMSLVVEIFDPALPFQTYNLKSSGIDTWHDYSLITEKTRAKLKQVYEKGMRTLNLSGGMSIKVPLLEIGIKIGSIKIDKVEVLVVDKGNYEILLGSNVINKSFEIGKHEDNGASVTSKWKEDPTALSLELYPVNMPFDIYNFENFLCQKRKLYNILLLIGGEINIPEISHIDDFIDKDEGISLKFKLQLSWIDSGSIWVSLKSGSEKTLKRLGSLWW